MSATVVASPDGEAPSRPPGDARVAALDALRVEHLRRGGEVTGRLSSGSMIPTIAIGDEVVVAPLVSARRGMIVLFLRDGALTVHRLIGRAGRGAWLEMGDANSDAARVAEAELLGTIVEVRKPSGTVRLAGRRARAAAATIAAVRRLELRLAAASRAPGLSLVLRIVRRAADVLIRGAARPTECA